MPFLRDFRLGLSGFFRAFRFALRNHMGWMFFVPVLLWAVLTFTLVAVLRGPVDDLSLWLASRLEIPVEATSTSWWTEVKAYLNGAREVVLGFLLKLAVAYLLFILNKYIVLILLSPLMAYASERTEELLTDRTFPFSWRQLMKDALRGALIAARNGFLELSITVALWVITFFVPILAPVTFVVLFLVSAYFYGFSMFDYVFERKRMRIGESVKAVNDRKGAVMANGSLFGLFMNVPLLGVMFAPVMAAIGAAITNVELERSLYGRIDTTGEPRMPS